MAFLARLKDLLVAFVMTVEYGVFLETTCFSPRNALRRYY